MKYLFRYIFYKYIEHKFNILEILFWKIIIYTLVLSLGYSKEIKNGVTSCINKNNKYMLRMLWFLVAQKISYLQRTDYFFGFSENFTSNFFISLYQNLSNRKTNEIVLAEIAQKIITANLKTGEIKKIQTELDLKFEQLYIKHRNNALAIIKDKIENFKKKTIVDTKQTNSKTRTFKTIDNFLHKKQIVNMKNLQTVVDICAKSGLESFAISGTLLGLIREGKLLNHDLDIDIGIFSHDTNIAKLINNINEHSKLHIKSINYCIYKKSNEGYYKDELPILIKVASNFGTHVDICIFNKMDDKLVMGSSSQLWHYQPFGIKHLTVLDYKIPVPENHDDFLTATYGLWQQERKSFQYHTDTFNMMLSKATDSEFYGLKLANSLVENNPDQANKIILEIYNNFVLEENQSIIKDTRKN